MAILMIEAEGPWGRLSEIRWTAHREDPDCKNHLRSMKADARPAAPDGEVGQVWARCCPLHVLLPAGDG